MTSQEIAQDILYECPICLSILVSPITLTCGHSFCQPCIKTKYFELVKHVCPICRKKIACELDLFAANVILEHILQSKYGKQKSYKERMMNAKVHLYIRNDNVTVKIKKWVKEKLPWIIILILLYHLFKVKLNFFSLKFKDYKDKALGIANSIKVENSLDFKFLLFSQFMRLLFSTIVIP